MSSYGLAKITASHNSYHDWQREVTKKMRSGQNLIAALFMIYSAIPAFRSLVVYNGNRYRPKMAETKSPANQPMPGSIKAAPNGLPPTVAPNAPIKALTRQAITATSNPRLKSRIFMERLVNKKRAPTSNTTNGSK